MQFNYRRGMKGLETARAHFAQITSSTIDPTPLSLQNVYTHPYEEFRIELRPATGAVLSLDRQLPAVYSTIMVLE